MAFPRVYSSFAEFEHEELRKLDSRLTTNDHWLEELYPDALSLFVRGGGYSARRRRGRPRKQRP